MTRSLFRKIKRRIDWEGNKHGHGNKHDPLLLPAKFLLGSHCPDLTPRGQRQVNATHAAQLHGTGRGGGEWGLRGLEGTSRVPEHLLFSF